MPCMAVVVRFAAHFLRLWKTHGVHALGTIPILADLFHPRSPSYFFLPSPFLIHEPSVALFAYTFPSRTRSRLSFRIAVAHDLRVVYDINPPCLCRGNLGKTCVEASKSFHEVVRVFAGLREDSKCWSGMLNGVANALVTMLIYIYHIIFGLAIYSGVSMILSDIYVHI